MFTLAGSNIGGFETSSSEYNLYCTANSAKTDFHRQRGEGGGSGAAGQKKYSGSLPEGAGAYAGHKYKCSCGSGYKGADGEDGADGFHATEGYYLPGEGKDGSPGHGGCASPALAARRSWMSLTERVAGAEARAAGVVIIPRCKWAGSKRSASVTLVSSARARA